MSTKKRPNIIFFLEDHQAFYGHGEMVGGPKIEKPYFKKVANQGVEFTHAYTACPLCAPARRTILTGIFPHAHGELSNISFHPFERETYLDKLAEAGYKNYYYGKWHAGPGTAHDHYCEGFSYPDYNNPYTKKEYKKYLQKYDLSPFQVKIQHSFMDPDIVLWKMLKLDPPIPGKLYSPSGPWCNEHATGIMTTPKESHEAFFLADLACEKLKELANSDNTEPFHLRVDFWGPHQPYFTTQEYLDMYNPEDIPEHPNFGDNLKNKPRIYQKDTNYQISRFGKLKIPSLLPWSEWQKVLALCYAQQTLVDEAAGKILDFLDKLGLAENTVIIWAADHGDAVACHGGHFDKDTYMPEEMIRIPLAIKYPKEILAGLKCDQLVSNIDIAPTILDIAGNSFTNPVHGQSLFPLLSEKDYQWREDLMCEINGHISPHLGRAILTSRYKYIYNERDMDELYDLEKDPYELNNLIKENDYTEILEDMKERLQKWRNNTGDKIIKKDIHDDKAKFMTERTGMSILFEQRNKK